MGDSGYTTTPSALHQGDFIADDVVYKLTSNSEIVVARHVSLHSTKFYTYQDQEHDRERKSWILDRRCQLVPRFAHEIDKAVPKTIRPKRTWTITATVNGKGEPIMLYMFQLTWPRGWAAKGYTSFMFGFKTLADARRWHDNFSRVIDKLRDKHGRGGHAADLYTTSVTPSGTRHQHDINLEKESTHSHYESGQRTPMSVDTNAGDPFSGVPSSPTKYYDALAPANVSLFATPMLEPTHTEDHHDRSTLQQSTTNDDSSEDEEEATHRHNRAQSLKERWIPYKQVNGLSVYYHHHDGDNQSGGEYMVSAVVHGSPRRVLDVLMHGSANTTILGPARKVDILEVTKINENTTKELVRLTIEAPGWAGLFCAPREIVVERMCKSDPNRSYVVMFNSSDDVELRSRAYCSKNSQGIVSPMSPTNGINGEQCSIQTQEEAMGQRTRRSIWRTAVQGSVSGCYTISCLNHMTLANSRESLITCMVKVDLKGACASDTYIGALCDVFGWREAFLDRVLMNVMLVRDEVEHRRFKVQPQDMMSAQPLATPLESSGPKGSMRSQVELNGTPGGAAMGRPGFINRSMTMALGPDYIVKGTVPPISIMRSNINVPPNLATSSRMTNQEESQPPAYEPAAEDTHATETGHAILDYAIMEKLSTLPKKYWSGIHTEGTDAPYSVRGPTYLKDRKKVKAGLVQFAFSAMDLIVVPGVTQHVARFLPSVRNSGMPFGIIINLIIPGTPMLNVVATFATEQHPGKVLSNPPSDPMDDGHNWQPFDFAMHKFYYGSDETRNKMLKLIPHIADGSWMIKSSVGTVPVILGKALKTTYHVTPQYIEIDIDISANSVANYVTGLVRGATKSLVIDMGFVLEGTTPWELPENLLGAIRLNHLDIKEAVKIDVSRELPLVPPRYKHDPDMTGTEPPTPTGMTTPVIPEDAPASHLTAPSAFDGPAAAQAMNSPGPKVKIPPAGAYATGPATGPASTGRPAGTPMGTLQPSSSGNLGGATAFGARHRHTRTGSNIDPALLSNLAGDRHQAQAPPSPR